MVEYKKVKNSDKFRQAAIRFQQLGFYTAAPRGTTAYKEYWDEERRRCLEGYSADDGDFISAGLTGTNRDYIITIYPTADFAGKTYTLEMKGTD